MAGRPAKAARYCPAVSPPPLLGGDVRERPTERPLVPEGVLYVVLALAVFEVGRLHEDLGAVRPGRSQCVRASSTRTTTEWVTSPC